MQKCHKCGNDTFQEYLKEESIQGGIRIEDDFSFNYELAKPVEQINDEPKIRYLECEKCQERFPEPVPAIHNMIKLEHTIFLEALKKEETIVLENGEIIHLFPKIPKKIFVAIITDNITRIFQVKGSETLTIINNKETATKEKIYEGIIDALKECKWINCESENHTLLIKEEKK